MNIIFELRSRKGGARQVEIDKIGESCWIDYQKNAPLGSTIKFKILEYEEEFGQPYLKKYIIGKVIKTKLAKKIVVAKYKSKKRYEIKKSHPPQPYTLIQIIGVENAEPHTSPKS